MTTKWRLIGLSAVVAALLSASPAFAVDPEKSKDLADIQKQLERIQNSLDRDLRDLREDMEFTKKVRIPGLENDIRGLKQELVRMADEIERLRTTSARSRTSYYAGPAATSTIRLRNSHFIPVTFVVNDQIYEVSPGALVTLNNQPAGEFTYEIFGIQPRVRRTRTLVANTPFDIEVIPR